VTGLETTIERLGLRTERAFGISRGTTERAENLLVRVSDGDHEGLGGAAPAPYYGETVEGAEAALPELLDTVRDLDPADVDARHDRMDAVGDNQAAKAAVDVACYDLVAKRAGEPLVEYLSLDRTEGLTSSYTISLAAPETMARTATVAVEAGYTVLKLKLGGGDGMDRERVRAVRRAVPEATLRVDANGAWEPREAIRNGARLADAGVEFVEQPVPAEDHAGLRRVHRQCPVPVAVDEACVDADEVGAVADRADVVVVKLMKCGGIAPALRQIHRAGRAGLDVMLGCMLESNASIAAAAHLVPKADYADLDGSLLLVEDPVDWYPMPGGRIDPSGFDRAGTGARYGGVG
jgi:L-alanine-DL-glutamate epimerase-like enolase superfamily enzyme